MENKFLFYLTWWRCFSFLPRGRSDATYILLAIVSLPQKRAKVFLYSKSDHPAGLRAKMFGTQAVCGARGCRACRIETSLFSVIMVTF